MKRNVTLGKILILLVVSFAVLTQIDKKIHGAMFIFYFLIPVFLLLLSKCKCKQCGSELGLYFEKLDIASGKCTMCVQKDKTRNSY